MFMYSSKILQTKIPVVFHTGGKLNITTGKCFLPLSGSGIVPRMILSANWTGKVNSLEKIKQTIQFL